MNRWRITTGAEIRAGNRFNEQAADRVVRFIEMLRHADGEFHGKPFRLLEWQKDAVCRMYGTQRKRANSPGRADIKGEEWIRQYQYLYLEIPKKNGKSELAAALGLYHLTADGERGGEVYLCAADRENAGIVYRAAVGMLEQCPALKKRCKIVNSQKIIRDKVSGSALKVMSAEAYSKHGYKPSCVIFDELHAQPNRDLWDVMTFGAGAARRQPVWIVLTTAGNDPNRHSIGWEQHEYARKIIAGEIDDPTWLPYIYGAPEDADIWDEITWQQANPSLGLTISLDAVRQEALAARNSAERERLFRWLRLNQWLADKGCGWLPLSLWDKTVSGITLAELAGMRCYAGLDLSTTTDLTALAIVFPPQDGLDTWQSFFWAWLPRATLHERVRRGEAPFDTWERCGLIQVTEGDVVDYEAVRQQVLKIAEECELAEIGADQWNATMLLQKLEEDGVSISLVRQSMSGMSPPMKEMDAMMRTATLRHEDNPLARWCFGNVVCAVDGNENIKPMKNLSRDRIDVAVAWINAMAVALKGEGSLGAYEAHGLKMI